MGLKTPKRLPMGASEKEQSKSAWDTDDSVHQRLAAQGLGLGPEPTEQLPTLTAESLNTATHEEYLQLNALYLQWLNYVLPRLAHVKGSLLQVKNWKTDIEMRTKDRIKRAEDELRAPKKDRTTREDLEMIVWLDPTYQQLMQLEQSIMQERLVLDAHIECLERTMRVISRHVEVKKIELEQNRIEGNMPRRHLRSPNTPVHT